MTVYVGPSIYPFGRMIMCHMTASTTAELNDMADKIGVARRHFQDGPRPHYDISKSKRAIAVRCGSIEVSDRVIVKMATRLAIARAMTNPERT